MLNIQRQIISKLESLKTLDAVVNPIQVCIEIVKKTKPLAETMTFLHKGNMKQLGFDLIEGKDDYLKYQNDGTKHYNTDYNKEFPEPKGKVIVYVNLGYTKDHAYVSIDQDGGTRSVFVGVVRNEDFFKEILYSIR